MGKKKLNPQTDKQSILQEADEIVNGDRGKPWGEGIDIPCGCGGGEAGPHGDVEDGKELLTLCADTTAAAKDWAAVASSLVDAIIMYLPEYARCRTLKLSAYLASCGVDIKEHVANFDTTEAGIRNALTAIVAEKDAAIRESAAKDAIVDAATELRRLNHSTWIIGLDELADALDNQACAAVAGRKGKRDAP